MRNQNSFVRNLNFGENGFLVEFFSFLPQFIVLLFPPPAPSPLGSKASV